MIIIKAYYIKEADKPNIIKQLLNLVEIKNNELIIQPIKPKTKQKKITKLGKKITKKCTKKNVASIVLSKNLQNNKELKQAIIENNLNIFDGRWLFNFMAYETIDYIVQKTNRKKEITEVTILTSNITHQAIETVKMLVKEYKRVNIVTNNISKFKYLETKIYNEYGVMITVTNNKRKSLAKSEIILNFDFSSEMISQYNIYDKAIIINIYKGIQIKKKRFNGTCVNNYELYSTRADDYFGLTKLKEFFLRDLLEAKLYRKASFLSVRQDIVKGHFKIKELYGVNGQIFVY